MELLQARCTLNNPMKKFDMSLMAARWKTLVLLLVCAALGQTARCADGVTVRPLGQGVYLKHFQYDSLYDSPQSFWVIDADLNVPGVAVKFPHLTGSARSTVSEFAARTPGALAVVNAQFFDAKGSIQFLKVDGELVNETQSAAVHDQQAIAVDERGAIGIRLKPSSGWSSLSSLPTIVSSGVGLIANGVRASFDPADATYAKRHPRTCVAMTTNNHLLVVVIDGRSARAAGQSGEEMQSTLLRLGPIINAFNFDGGGSTTLWASGAVLNQPSGGTQRPVANVLALFAKPYQAKVQSLVLGAVREGEEKRPRAQIKIVDGAGVPIEGANVIVRFTGAITERGLLATTNAQGIATITSTTTIAQGSVRFMVESVRGPNLIWNGARASVWLRLPRNP
ncbi:MAG: hypothetical protein JWN98_751 [Abditibacteriota bacterium]|nr:hypothetical protein [Abditibacteriota bacterium]